MPTSNLKDFLIAGAGIVGTCVALELKKRHPTANICVLDKEIHGHAHSSGRNSGVIHAGFYYSPGSLKSKMTAAGNSLLTNYCQERGIPINACGKLVVAKDESEHQRLSMLLDRGNKNNAQVELLDLKQAKEIEPRVKTFSHALWSPKTKVSDPVAVLKALQKDAQDLGVEFNFGCQVLGRQNNSAVQTKNGVYEFGYFINAAGLQADIVAHSFGFGLKYQILPFKGLYLYSDERAPKFRTNIYPVPDLNYPFLGVHVTQTLDGRSKLGPTAIPALWREQYAQLENFKLNEFSRISARHGWFVIKNGRQFFKMAIEEMRKYNRKFMVKRAQELATDIENTHFVKWGKPGIRAQLVNLETAKLEMDFLIEGDSRSLHILNAVSPGWTCSLPFSSFVCDNVERFQKLNSHSNPQVVKESHP